jgi:hypothetical protein
MNESRQSKIEEIRKKSLETLRDARLAEQEKRRLDARFSLNEKVSGAAAGAAGGAAGGGGGSQVREIPAIAGLASTFRLIDTVNGAAIPSALYSGNLEAYAKAMPTNGGKVIYDKLTGQRKTDSSGPDNEKYEKFATYWRSTRDGALKASNEYRLAEMDGVIDLNRTAEWIGKNADSGQVESSKIVNLTSKEAFELQYAPAPSILNNSLYPGGWDGAGSFEVGLVYGGIALNGRGMASFFRGQYQTHKAIQANLDDMKSQLEQLKAEATKAGESAAYVLALTFADTQSYKETRWPQLKNSVLEYGDMVLVTPDNLPIAAGSQASDVAAWSWQPSYSITEDNVTVTRKGHWSPEDGIVDVTRTIDVYDAKGGVTPTSFTKVFTDENTEYRATRDQVLKESNEVCLSFAPAIASQLFMTAGPRNTWGAELSTLKEMPKLPYPRYNDPIALNLEEGVTNLKVTNTSITFEDAGGGEEKANAINNAASYLAVQSDLFPYVMGVKATATFTTPNVTITWEGDGASFEKNGEGTPILNVYQIKNAFKLNTELEGGIKEIDPAYSTWLKDGSFNAVVQDSSVFDRADVNLKVIISGGDLSTIKYEFTSLGGGYAIEDKLFIKGDGIHVTGLLELTLTPGDFEAGKAGKK